MQRSRYPLATLALLAGLAGCASESGDAENAAVTSDTAAVAAGAAEGAHASPIAALLDGDRAVFGYYPRNPNPQQADSLAGNPEIDFIMLSQEDELDIPALQAYVTAMNEASARAGVDPIPVLVRMPSADSAAAVRERVQQVVAAGVGGIVFPHVGRAEQAEMSVEAMGDALWREGSPAGNLVNVQIIEEQEGVANAQDIADTEGLSVVFAGPGTLSRSYNRDSVAVENAIQTVLAGCKAADVPCGITAGPEDIEQRLREGFGVIIVYDPAALAIGRRATGRTD